MNSPELIRMASQLHLHSEPQCQLRLAFGIACAEYVEHMLTDVDLIGYLKTGKEFLLSADSSIDIQHVAEAASRVARSHAGSGSIDGSGNAAVSSGHCVAAALAGKALLAAEYCAYAAVYSYAGYAVTDLSAYEEVHCWQVEKLRALAVKYA